MAERGNYRSIACALLAGKDFRKLAERQRWIFVVLKLNLSGPGIDVWYPDELISRLTSESGASADQVKLSLDILEHEGWVRREENVIWAVGQLSFDPHLKPSDIKHRKSVQRHVAGLPRMALVRAFVEAHPEFFPASEGRSMGLGWAFDAPPKPLRRPKKGPSKQEEEKEEEKDLSGGPDNNWVADGAGLWSEKVSPIEPGRFGRSVKPMVKQYGWPDTRSALLFYIEDTEGKPRRVEWFVADAVRCVRLGKMKLVDDTGGLTERGELARRQVARLA